MVKGCGAPSKGVLALASEVAGPPLKLPRAVPAVPAPGGSVSS